MTHQTFPEAVESAARTAGRTIVLLPVLAASTLPPAAPEEGLGPSTIVEAATMDWLSALAGAEETDCVAMKVEDGGTEVATPVLTPTESDTEIDELERIDDPGDATVEEGDAGAVPAPSIEVGAGCAVTVTTTVLTTREVDTTTELDAGRLDDWVKEGNDAESVDKGRLGSGMDEDADADTAAGWESVEIVTEDDGRSVEEGALDIAAMLVGAAVADCTEALDPATLLADASTVLAGSVADDEAAEGSDEEAPGAGPRKGVGTNVEFGLGSGRSAG